MAQNYELEQDITKICKNLKMKFRVYLLVYSTPLKEKNPSHTYSNCLTVVHHISPYSTPYAHILGKHKHTNPQKSGIHIYS